jgi:thioester reductase-like protein
MAAGALGMNRTTGAATGAGPSPTESVILSAACATLGRPLALDDIATPLSLLGADSLGIIELTAAVEDAVGVAAPLELAHESMTIRELAAWIDGARCDRRPGSDPFEQMLADSSLPGDVQPGPAQHPVSLLESRAILLTGATGFLGGQLAADLLARSNATLYCTVRPGRDAPETRLRRHLMRNGADPSAISARVVAVDADLARPRLGLDIDTWQRLGATVDCVLHAGASVNWIAPYASLRASNVQGTLELLRLACRPVPRPFHFVSSLSVCYAVDGPPTVDESFEPLTQLRGVHLGYAQTKIVGESLVREAGRRGLPVSIYRPSLIAGHSRTGAFNPDDLLSVLIRGCLRMATAPDLDWTLDCEPVDAVSAAILALSSHTGPMHLVHSRPRHWRECLLWMRLTGHAVRLVPYSDWLEQLDAETTDCADHPLRPLRSFFLDRPAKGLTLPELYEDGRRSKASSARTNERLPGEVRRPALDGALLDCYFSAYYAAGYLATPGRAATPQTNIPTFDEAFFQAALAARGLNVDVQSATRVATGSEHSIISELTAWRSRQPAGLFRYRLELEAGRVHRTVDAILKLKPHADDVTAVGEALARLCDPRVGEAFARCQDRTGFAASHLRERAIYETQDERLTRFMPDLLGVADLDARGGAALLIEDVSGATLMDSIERTPSWSPEHIGIVVRDLAAVHAVWYGRTASLRALPWVGFVQSATSMGEMSDLWIALADHAARPFAEWAGEDFSVLHRELVDSVADWQPFLDEDPQTLIHNDFNPRNICLREREGGLSLCAYDWELATLGAPQRDLAELLCFVLPASATNTTIDFWIERHRAALADAVGRPIDRGRWQHGFRAAMNELLVNRLAFYALVHRVRRQPFLPRVLRTWRRIHECCVDRAGDHAKAGAR